MITYWHNPRCSKSRAGLALFENKGIEVETRQYLKDAPTLVEIQQVQIALGVATVDMMRSKDALFKELGLSKDCPEAELQAAMAENPALIERPIAIKGSKAVIGRPTKALEALL